MRTPPPLTYFDTPDRSSEQELAALREILESHPAAMALLEGYPSAAILLSKNREIAAFNGAASRLFGWSGARNPTGMRIGEAVGCIHADEMPAGCGTSKCCKDCGLAQAIRFTRERRGHALTECRITTRQDGESVPVDIRAFTSTVDVGERLTFAAVEDLAVEKDRAALARLFFDEVGATATEVAGLARLISESSDPEVVNRLRLTAARSIRQLGDAIAAARELVAAENGELAVALAPTSANAILDRLVDRFRASCSTQDAPFDVERLSPDAPMESDPEHAARALETFVQHALDGSAQGERVTVSAESSREGVVFRVSHPRGMPRDLQRQLFDRSFTPKRTDARGMGAYGARLIVEAYLGGDVAFTSREGFGTIFSVRLPRLAAREVIESVRFDELLVESGLISEKDLHAAREHAALNLKGLAEVVVALGFVTEEDAYRTLAQACRLPFRDLDVAPPDRHLAALIPERLARRHAVVPLSEEGRALAYGVARPFDAQAHRDLVSVAGRPLQRVLVCPSQITQWLQRLYPRDLRVWDNSAVGA